MEHDRIEELPDDVVEAALVAEFGVYRLATEAPPPVPAFEDVVAQTARVDPEPSVDDLIELATLHDQAEGIERAIPNETAPDDPWG